MNENEEIELKNVNEYEEGESVFLRYEMVNVERGKFIHNWESDEAKKSGQRRLCVVALNEGGYNCTCVDAEQLYKALKNYFENKQQENN